MGQSTPTTTIAFDIFAQRYAHFRAELEPAEQVWFDEMLCRARRHSSAINRRPHLDFERPVMLAMLLEGMRMMEDTRTEMALLQKSLEQAIEALCQAGLMAPPRRVRPAGLGRVGQTVLTASV